MAPQLPAELLVDDWAQEQFDKIIDFVKFSGDAFQDVPFSLPKTYKHLDQTFPDSKFILTIRKSADEWYQSLINYHSNHVLGGKRLGKSELQNSEYVKKGWMYKVIKSVYNTSDNSLYDEKTLKTHYENHNKEILEYFRDRQDKLLVINVAEPNAAKKISEFLGAKKSIEDMPWKNKTRYSR